MPTNLEQLQKDLNKKPSMLMEVSELKDIMVTKSQVKQVLDALISKLQEGERRMAELVSKTDTALKADYEKAYTEMLSETEKVRTLVESFKNETKSDQRTLSRMLEQRISDLTESLPEEYNDEELRTELNELKTAFDNLDIPEQFDATDLVKQVDKNTEDIEELKKRPTGSVQGGVTNMRIIQAMKTAVKTEEPVGDIDGVNTAYTVSQPIFAILSFSLNGEFIAQLPNYTVSGKTITFASALPAAYSGKDFEVTYF